MFCLNVCVCVCDVSVDVCVRTDLTSNQTVTVFPWQWLEPQRIAVSPTMVCIVALGNMEMYSQHINYFFLLYFIL